MSCWNSLPHFLRCTFPSMTSTALLLLSCFFWSSLTIPACCPLSMFLSPRCMCCCLLMVLHFATASALLPPHTSVSSALPAPPPTPCPLLTLPKISFEQSYPLPWFSHISLETLKSFLQLPPHIWTAAWCPGSDSTWMLQGHPSHRQSASQQPEASLISSSLQHPIITKSCKFYLLYVS